MKTYKPVAQSQACHCSVKIWSQYLLASLSAEKLRLKNFKNFYLVLIGRERGARYLCQSQRWTQRNCELTFVTQFKNAFSFCLFYPGWLRIYRPRLGPPNRQNGLWTLREAILSTRFGMVPDLQRGGESRRTAGSIWTSSGWLVRPVQ